MARLRVRNFGPIREGNSSNDGWIDFGKVTVFIGDQGSGKSTIAKLFSSFSWMEKALVRGDLTQAWLGRKGRFRSHFLEYHRLENYFQTHQNPAIEYEGSAFHIQYAGGNIISARKDGYLELPQIMYVPAERNFLSYVQNPKSLKLSSESLQEFLDELVNAKSSIKDGIQLPISNDTIEYDKQNDILNLRGSKTGYKLRLAEASSGFQSAVPLYLVSQYFATNINKAKEQAAINMSTVERDRFSKEAIKVIEDQKLPAEQKRILFSHLLRRFHKTSFLNIVEEPEQNLFPSSQTAMLNSLLEFNQMGAHNGLVMTTHSPYIVGHLSLITKAHALKTAIEKSNNAGQLLEKLSKVVPLGSLTALNDVNIYQLHPSNGTLTKLAIYDDIPTDGHELNRYLRKGNEQFDALLNIEDEL